MSKRYYMEFERPIVELEHKLTELRDHPKAGDGEISAEIDLLESQIDEIRRRTYENLTAWQKVQVSRHPERPRFTTYRSLIFDDFIELHGDRIFKDDAAIIGGLARIDDVKVVLIGQEKGTTTRERVHRNFGMAHPEGYRKALRLFRMAGKFGLPLITFIDTPGAYAGVGAEERGQAGAIADCLRTLSSLPTAIVAVNIGEGGSGGALALGVANRVFMLENSYYSVITPEGCASILWGEQGKAAEAAESLTLTAPDLMKMGIVDTMIDEPVGGAHRDPRAMAADIKSHLLGVLGELAEKEAGVLVDERYTRFRQIGVWLDESEADVTA